MGNIEKIFLQVNFKEKDLNALCFVWRDSDQDEILDQVMLSHLFGKKDSTCIANWSLNLPRTSQTNNFIWTIF